jgi:hypothetical protein
MRKPQRASKKDLIDLYTLLVGQLQNYNGIIWQIPVALVAANFVALDYAQGKPWALLPLAIFNGVMIYAFYKMVVRQSAIIEATRSAERRLALDYGDVIPSFRKHGFSAPCALVVVLSMLDIALLIYFFAMVF